LRIILLALLLTAIAWADSERFGRVAVVLSTQGPAKWHGPNQPPSRFSPVQVLDSLEFGQTLKLEPNASVTLSVLSTGTRYRLTGPLIIEINSKTPFKSGQGVVEESKQPGRSGLAASQQVDLTKFGGASSRKLGYPVYTDSSSLVLDLDVLPKSFQVSSLKVFYRLADNRGEWTPVESSLYHYSNQRDQLHLSAALEAGKDYLVYIGDKLNPDDSDAQYRALRLPAEVTRPLNQLEENATDWPGQIELFHAYWRLRLFAKAESLLGQMQKQHPDHVNWGLLQDKFQDDRRDSNR